MPSKYSALVSLKEIDDVLPLEQLQQREEPPLAS